MRVAGAVFLSWKEYLCRFGSAQPLVLASKSDVRGEMLAAAGLRIEIRPGQIDERAV